LPACKAGSRALGYAYCYATRAYVLIISQKKLGLNMLLIQDLDGCS